MIDIIHKKPRKELSKYVRKISVFKSKKEIKFRQKLTPSAFTYLSYNLEEMPIFVSGNKKARSSQRLQITGPKTNADLFVEYNGRLTQVLIEFAASGFYGIFRISPSKLTNTSSDLNNFINPDLSGKLEKELLKLETLSAKITRIEDLIMDLIIQVEPPVNYVDKAVDIIESQNGNISINNLMKNVHISERQFNRKFKEIVGISPKCYAKIFQLHYVINLIQRKGFISIQDLAYDSGFYDLSHFDHRFKELTGFSPIEFINSEEHIALKYFTDLIKKS
jgi:AraC-like DNA-binding protein